MYFLDKRLKYFVIIVTTRLKIYILFQADFGSLNIFIKFKSGERDGR